MFRFVRCDCDGHGIGVKHEPEETDKGKTESVTTYLSYWVMGKWNMGVFDKIRYCWHIITTGNIYEDMVMLEEADRKKLIVALLEADDLLTEGG